MSSQPEKPAAIIKRVEQSIADIPGFKIPSNYDIKSALRQAQLILQETTSRGDTPVPALEYCTRESIGSALLDMVMRGLNPGRNQCALIIRGKKLVLQIEYQGRVAQARRTQGLKTWVPQIVYGKDTFEYTTDLGTGDFKVTKHVQSLANISGNIADIVGAYCVLTFEDRPPYTEIMSMEQIISSWRQGDSYRYAEKNNKLESTAHHKFPDQMVKKTVTSRALKPFIDSGDDSDLVEMRPSDGSGEYAEQQQNDAPEFTPVAEVKEEPVVEDQVAEVIEDDKKETKVTKKEETKTETPEPVETTADNKEEDGKGNDQGSDLFDMPEDETSEENTP